MSRFYVNIPLILSETIELPTDVVRHLIVLRHRTNDQIILFNGNGDSYESQIIEITRKTVTVKITKHIKNNQENNLKIHLLLCIIANDKMDLAIQKAIEIGVTEITPIISERSQKLHTDKITKRMEHWQKIIISSCEQSGNNVIPQLNHALQFSKISANNDINLIMSTNNLHQKYEVPKKNAIIKQVQLLIGPEGGFSQSEQIDGFIPLMLGKLILRSETAVIAGLSYVQLNYGNW